MGDVSLDIPEVQVVVNYPLDPGGFYWHHRVLLHRISGSRWLTLTPDHDIVQHDLQTIPHRILNRRSAFPPDIVGEIYAHDEVGRSQLQVFKRTAKIQAAILGDGDIEDSEAAVWVVAETGHEDFGKEIDEELLNNGATGLSFSLKGVATIRGEEVFVERVLNRELADWRKRKGLETGDLRLLGDHVDSSGLRRLDLVSAVSLMKGTTKDEDPDFPIAGVRASKEYHEGVASGPGNFLSYHTEWLRLSGVGRRASAAHIHRNLCEVLRLLHTYDQIDGSTTAVGEFLCRWAIQTELAVERSPGQPDYTGLDIISGSSVQNDGRASTAKFTEWVSNRLKERAQVWKQERLYAQERGHLRGGRKGAGKGDDDSDEEAGGKKKKKKKKGHGKGGDKDPPAAS